MNVDFEGNVEEINVPNNAEVTIRDVKRIVRNAFPDEASFARQLPILKKGDVVSLLFLSPLLPSPLPLFFIYKVPFLLW